MAKKAFRDQYEDEEVLYFFRKHPVVMRKGLILFMFSILLGTIPSFIKPEFSYFYGGLGAGFVIGILAMLPAWIYWYFTVFILTDKRFIQQIQRGFFHRTVSDLALKHVQSTSYQINGVQETLLGFGTILLQTYLGDILIHDVHHPEKIANEISALLREYGVTEDEPIQAAEVSHER